MKIFKNKIILILLIVVIVGGVIYLLNGKKAQTEYLTEQVKRGDLIQSVSVTGKVESVSETDLNFKISGRLSELFVKDGEKVKRGQFLARLESGQQQSVVNRALAQVNEAKANLSSVLEGYSNEDIAITQAKVNQAQADLDSKETVLKNAQMEKSQNINSLKEQALDKASKSLFTAKDALEDADEIINNDQYTDGLKVFIVSYNQALGDYNTAFTRYNAVEASFDNYSLNDSDSEIAAYLDDISLLLSDTDALLDSVFSLLSVASPVYNITQTNIDTWKSAIITDQTNVSADISAAQTAKANLRIKSVEYDNAIKDDELDIEKAQTALKVAEAELELKLAEPRNFEIDLQNARVNIAEANLQAALADLDDYRLVSPIDGIITKIHYKLGEFVGSSQPLLSLIGESNLQIEVDVPESDIAKVKIGDLAKITLDAFTEEQIFTSHITYIDPAESVINEVVYYKIKLVFDEEDEQIKSGMTANVVITTATRENVLYIPLRAVLENGKKIVRVLENNQKIEKEVQIGLKADDGLVEILSGLEEGETVITYIKNGK